MRFLLFLLYILVFILSFFVAPYFADFVLDPLFKHLSRGAAAVVHYSLGVVLGYILAKVFND